MFSSLVQNLSNRVIWLTRVIDDIRQYQPDRHQTILACRLLEETDVLNCVGVSRSVCQPVCQVSFIWSRQLWGPSIVTILAPAQAAISNCKLFLDKALLKSINHSTHTTAREEVKVSRCKAHKYY